MVPKTRKQRNSTSTCQRDETKPLSTRRGDSMRSIVPFLALLVPLLGRTALADPGALIVNTSGKVAERDRSLAMNAAENRLRTAGWEFRSQRLTSREIEAVTTC